MTVSYQYDVASSSTGGFFRLLWRWRGSIWKLLYKELVLFIAVYLSIALSYDFLMTDYYKRYYERIVIFCSAFVEIIPLSFILGFYVSFTATRWWQQYTAIPWPDKLMNIIALYVPGNDVTSRVLRRTLMRYLNLTLVLVLRSISIPVKRRFPTKEHLVEAGFMSRPELDMYSSVPSHEFNTFWIPCTWFVNLLREAKSECRITDSGGIKLIMEEFNEFRSKCGLLWSYDWVSIPLVYTQVVTLSTQAFFLASLLGRQHINPPKDQDIKSHVYGEYYIPIFTLLQFILYMGMLKLGEQLINPFGDDDEDFELNWIIDRHLKVSFLGVDILNSDPPPLMKDNYFDERDIKLPYTEAAVAHKVKTYRGSVAAFHVPTDKHGFVVPEFEDENEEDNEDDAASTVQSNRDANVRTSSWNLFGHKRKLSSSIDSFNSETMVETGLGENEEIPKLTANLSWPNFLISEAQERNPKSSKLHVWPSNFQNEQIAGDSQGIRWPNESESAKSSKDMLAPDGPHQGDTAAISKSNPDRSSKYAELAKQSSFSSDSSIVIPLGEDSDRRSSSNSYSRYFAFDKPSPQVFSKEGSNVPMSVFRDLEESYQSSSDRHSFSSLPFKIRDRLIKPPKSMMKNSRAADPKLRIRPFRSKVTFSVDTKTGDSPLPPEMCRDTTKRSFFSKFDSSSDSSVHKVHTKDNLLLLKQSLGIQPSKSISVLRGSTLKLPGDSQFADTSKRRQSLDPTMYAKISKPEEPQKDNWLHYQSLPNIQEEDQLQTTSNSPTETSAPVSIAVPDIAPPISPTPPPTPRVTSIPGNVTTPSATNSKPGTSTSPQTITPNVLLSPQPFIVDQNSWSRRRSIKRQKSQDLPDEDLKQKLPPPIPKMSPRLLRKQSSDESQTSNSSNSNQVNKGTTSGSSTTCMPPSILRRRKDELKSQHTSTESDTGSYHTVNSFRMHLEKSNSSSADSFTSANSESNNNANANAHNPNVLNRNGNLLNDISKSSTSQDQLNQTNINNNNNPYTNLVSSTSLVPKIIFSQSTPSVTSQSSDDQSSPKWNERTFTETGNEIPYLLSQIQTGFDPIQVSTSCPSLQQQQHRPAKSGNQSCHLNIQDSLDPLPSSSSGTITKTSTNSNKRNNDIPLEDIAVISNDNNNSNNGNDNKRSSSSGDISSMGRSRMLNS